MKACLSFRAINMAFLVLASCGEPRSGIAQNDGDGAESAKVPFSTQGWKTDFSISSVPFDEIISGGPPKDGIPAIDRPSFVPADEADRWLGAREPVVVFEREGEVRGYPWQILIWHEIVNDEVAGLPVTITYCPLCNTAIAFDRRVGDQVLDFGTTGKLRYSDLIMYDRQTETWWQQATGEAIIGELTGATLTFLAAPTISWSDFKQRYPEGAVLDRDTGYERPYGSSPYAGYDSGRPFLFRGRTDGRLSAMERVVVVRIGSAAIVYPLRTLGQERAVNHEVGGNPIVLFFSPGTASAVDRREIGGGRDVGSVTVYSRRVGEVVLTFRAEDDGFRDEETGSNWNLFGEAVSGPFAGERLESVIHYVPFWFAWAAFAPDTPIYGH